MRDAPQTLFLSRRDSPSREGWHYGRYSTSLPIMPHWVFFNSQKEWVAITGTSMTRVTKMQWFGSLPEVQEASSQ